MGNYLSVFARNETDPVKSSQTFGLTQSQNESFEFYWIVKNLSQLKYSTIESPEYTGGKAGHKWMLKLIPKKKADGEYCSGIYLYIKNPELAKISTDFKFISTLNGETKEYSGFGKFSKDNCCWGWCEFLNYPKHIDNDQVVIECQVTLKNLVTKSQIIDDIFLTKPNPPEKNFDKLHSDFGKLLKSPTETGDLRILVNEREFKAHRIILSARSPVFSRMLSTETGMKEAQSSIIKIDDFDPEIVESMLEFIYTGKTDIMVKNAFELYQIADKYDLPDLKGECEVELAKNLNFENALELFDKGEKYNGPYLKSQSLDFIKRNVKKFVEHPDFKENLKINNQLSFEILQPLLWDKKEQNILNTLT